jgi:hypothetical protein
VTGPEYRPFFEDLVELLCKDPVNEYVEILEEEDLVMYPTINAYKDFPPLWVYYRLRPDETIFVGLRRAYADTAFVPTIWE